MTIRRASIFLLLLTAGGCSTAVSTNEESEGQAHSYILEGVAGSEACLISDTFCLEAKFYVDCDPNRADVISSCLNWLATLESLEEANEYPVKQLLASTYYRLSDIRQSAELGLHPHLAGRSAELPDQDWLQQQVRSLAQAMYDANNADTSAMGWLALTSDSAAENLQWHRQIVRTEAPDFFTCRLLSGSLTRYHGSHLDRRANSEAARCFITSYENTPHQQGKWNSAAEAHSHLERAGQRLRKGRFIAQLKADINPRQRVEKFGNIRRLSSDEAEESLQILCGNSVRDLIGEEYCTEAISAALYSIAGLETKLATPYADAVMEGILASLQPVSMIVTSDRSLFRFDLTQLVYRTLLSRGIESGKIYSTYSILLGSSIDASIEAQLNAVAFEPSNADYRARLGDLYRMRGDMRLAREHYEIALPSLHESRQAAIRSLLDAMEAGVE